MLGDADSADLRYPARHPPIARSVGEKRNRIDAKSMTYAKDGSGDVKRLKGGSGCRLRIGDWRIIFIEDARSITVVGVGHRNDIYN
jgi:mRNA interferase RelE/StbE